MLDNNQYLISSIDEHDLSETYTDHREQRIYRFRNGLGASVVRRAYVSLEYPYHQHGSYGYLDGLWELAVIEWEDADRWHITYDTPVTDDVLGWLSEKEVNATLTRIQALPACTSHPAEEGSA